MLQSELKSRREIEEKSIAMWEKELVLQRKMYMNEKEKRETTEKEQTPQLQLLNDLINKLSQRASIYFSTEGGLVWNISCTWPCL